MPGVVGVIGSQRHVLKPMLQTMQHEAFYRSGTYGDEQLGIAVGWVSHAGSFSDSMPVWNEKREACLILTGEHFGDDDAHALLKLYETHGNKFPERLNGWFAGVLVDLREQKIVLFNDRYGLQRIYIHEDNSGFYFSSEAKALLNVLPATRAVDTVSLAEFFSCGCVLQNRSLFQRISLLPGGSAWIFSPGCQPKKGNYFSAANWERQSPLEPEEWYRELSETFRRRLPYYLGAEHGVGLSLTGGVDSRMVLAWAGPKKLPCYTFGGPYRDCKDVRIARAAARIVHQPHQVIGLGDEFLAEFPKLAERTVYLSDGVMDVSGAADLYVNRIARQIAPVRVTGNYGGEILRRLVAFKPTELDESVFADGFAPRLQEASDTYHEELRGNVLSFVAFKQVPWHHHSRMCLEQTQLTVRSPYLDNELVALAYRGPEVMTSSNAAALRLIQEGNPSLAQIGTDRGLLYKSWPIVGRLRHAYEQFTFKAEYAYDYGMPQMVAAVDHKLKALHLERLFLGRHKFHHFRLWYRDQLSNYLKEILLDPRSLGRPYLNSAVLERIVRDHTAGRRNYTLEIHRVLTMELMQRLLIEQGRN